MTPATTRDREALERCLSELDITVSQGSSGTYTVRTTCEPLFCYERPSIEEINDLVADTLQSYVTRFYGLPKVAISITTVNASSDEELPRETSTVLSRLKPVFDPLKKSDLVMV